MKTCIYVTGIAIYFLSTSVNAGPLTVPNAFDGGTTAVAAEVNANFNAVATEVNDNNDRISSNATAISTSNDAISNNTTAINNNTGAITGLSSSKQNRVSGVCALGYAVRVINADGSVMCERDDNAGGDITGVTAAGGLSGGGSIGTVTLRQASGSVSVASAAFHPTSSPGCEYITSTYFRWELSSTSAFCRAKASVAIPNGATVTRLTCWAYDNDPILYDRSRIRLLRKDLATGIEESIFTTLYTSDSTFIQQLQVNTPYVGALIDNSSYAYEIAWDSYHNSTSVGDNARLYSCKVDYTF